MKKYVNGIFDDLRDVPLAKRLLDIAFLNPWANEGFDYKDFVNVYSLGLVESPNNLVRCHLIAIVCDVKDCDSFAYRLCMINEVQGDVRSIMMMAEGQRLNGIIVNSSLKHRRNKWIKDESFFWNVVQHQCYLITIIQA